MAVRAKPLLAGMIALSLLGAAGAAASAATPPNVTPFVQHLMDARAAASVSGAAPSGLTAFYDKSSDGQASLSYEETRAKGIQQYAANHHWAFVSYDEHITVGTPHLDLQGDLMVPVDEAQTTHQRYLDGVLQGQIHLFSMTINHTLVLGQTAHGFVVKEDLYSDPYVPQLSQDHKTRITTTAPQPGAAPLASAFTAPAHRPRVNPNYTGSAAASYADTYCGAYSGCGNSQQYNCNYDNYGSETNVGCTPLSAGGDCTNFTSQALYAGGLPQDGTWNYSSSGGSSAWINVNSLYNWLMSKSYPSYAVLEGSGTCSQVSSAVALLQQGDVVFYDWNGGSSPTDHDAVIDYVDANGNRYVASHTNDRFQDPWDMGICSGFYPNGVAWAVHIVYT